MLAGFWPIQIVNEASTAPCSTMSGRVLHKLRSFPAAPNSDSPRLPYYRTGISIKYWRMNTCMIMTTCEP